MVAVPEDRSTHDSRHRGQPKRQVAGQRQRDEHSRNQQLVGDRVEQRAESRLPAKAHGEKPVEPGLNSFNVDAEDAAGNQAMTIIDVTMHDVDPPEIDVALANDPLGEVNDPQAIVPSRS